MPLQSMIDQECQAGGPARAVFSLLLVAASIAPLTAISAEEIYRWVDSTGTVHYTQVAPQGIAYDRVTPGSLGKPSSRGTLANPRARASAQAAETTPAPPTAAVPDPSSTALTETQRQLQQELRQEAEARLAEVRATRQENCRQAREQFRQFTTYARIRVTDDAGGARVLGEEERQQRIAEAQEAIVLNCEGGEG